MSKLLSEARYARWLSTERMTVRVEVDSQGMIVWASPLVRKFVGQQIYSLTSWMRRQGGLEIARL